MCHMFPAEHAILFVEAKCGMLVAGDAENGDKGKF